MSDLPIETIFEPFVLTLSCVKKAQRFYALTSWQPLIFDGVPTALLLRDSVYCCHCFLLCVKGIIKRLIGQLASINDETGIRGPELS
jgi:hypothetical protein